MYPPDLAALFKDKASQKYRPSNGTDGELFFNKFCDRCFDEPACDILHLTMILDEDDPSYPQEWQYGEDGQPVCTAFKAEGQVDQKGDDGLDCDVCGSADDDGCMFCRSCCGCYAPGSEECDFCPDSEECERDYIDRMENE